MKCISLIEILALLSLNILIISFTNNILDRANPVTFLLVSVKDQYNVSDENYQVW